MAVKRAQVYLDFFDKHYPGEVSTFPKPYPQLGMLGWVRDVAFTIGIFCFAHYSYPNLSRALKDAGQAAADIQGLEGDKSKVVVHLKGGGHIELALAGDTLRRVPMKGCEICTDLTALVADISIGSVGSPTGWATAVIRTDKGSRALALAREAGLLETGPAQPDLEAILRAEARKLERGTSRAEEYHHRLPPLFYDRDTYDYHWSIYDSLLQDFNTLSDVIKLDLCVGCGMCSLACPMGSISMIGNEVAFTGRCNPQVCGLCFSLCPQAFVFQGVEQRRFFQDSGTLHPTLQEGLFTARAPGGSPEWVERDVIRALVSSATDHGLVAVARALNFWNLGHLSRSPLEPGLATLLETAHKIEASATSARG